MSEARLTWALNKLVGWHAAAEGGTWWVVREEGGWVLSFQLPSGSRSFHGSHPSPVRAMWAADPLPEERRERCAACGGPVRRHPAESLVVIHDSEADWYAGRQMDHDAAVAEG
jgi:hypothetical protein